MKIRFILFPLFSAWIVGVSGFASIGEECEERETELNKTQPIGIHVGFDTISAAYAHSHDNVSLLAGFYVTHSSEDLYEYAAYIAQVRAEYYMTIFDFSDDNPWTVQKFGSKVMKWINSTLKGKVRGIYSSLYSREPTEETKKEQEVDKQKQRGIKAFAPVFDKVKQVAWEDSTVNITGAMIIYPDFFNETMRSIILEAAEKAGIDTMSSTMTPRELIAGANGLYFDLWVGNITDIRHTQREGVIIIDHGQFHVDVQTTGYQMHSMLFPLTTTGASAITKNLVNRTIYTDANIHQEILQGASYGDFYNAVWKARWKIKNCTATDAGEDDVCFDTWPLDLNGWWVGENRSAEIRKEDVQYVDDEYVRQLAHWLQLSITRSKRM
ncbi:hypothetical protein BGW36DRAFT_388998 [Talaromyces proteolyticus]|uniref:Uncharacterized protein n=1 Tax=Talaromyces proteolyticus TaxID=1131652 RepID=A0AAD4PVP5_9EURO|nr:uncharacterized protein BGW36DRAFT_388998 [Talaromyces proteolyticus]KAH8690580.1 hypothetical protein BGW36DRAFT_388998 [Talaromyces proteolyticus]